MAGCYREMKNYPESQRLFTEAMNLLISKYGEDNILTATVRNNLGLTYKRMGNFKEAEECYLKSLVVREKLLPEDHPDIIASKHNLGELYLATGNKEKAEKYMLEALELLKKANEAAKPSKWKKEKSRLNLFNY